VWLSIRVTHSTIELGPEGKRREKRGKKESKKEKGGVGGKQTNVGRVDSSVGLSAFCTLRIYRE